MKPEHKRYILENINKKPVKKIAQELNLKERKIRKFLEREGKGKEQIDLKRETKIPVKKQTILISIILIIILGFAVYGNSLNGEFVWDDEFLVEHNAYIKSWSRISNIFTKNIVASIGRKSSFYRPFQLFTYAINYSICKLDVKGYHLTNILLHILVALGIYWLINILYDNRLLSLFTSVLFVVHPIHTEAVAYISGRTDSLATLFMLTCFILYIKHLSSDKKNTYILMLLSYILALLSRENSLILPILLLLYHWTFKEKLKIRQFLPIPGIAFIYILFRLTALKALLSHISSTTTLFQRIPGFFVAISNYIRLLFLPFNLHMEYGNNLFNFTDTKTILGVIILLLLLIYAFKRRNTRNLIFFSISWFFITLLPQSNLYPINAYMAEHWLYLPSIGFFLILGSGLSYLYRRKESRILSICLITGLVSFHSYLTIKQNSYWREPITFYERTLRYAPESPRMHNNLGAVYLSLNRKEEAMTSFERAIEVNPDDVMAYNNLGVIYTDLGQEEKAIILFKKVIKINPHKSGAYYNLGVIYSSLGRKKEAIASFEKAIELNPNDITAFNELANLYNNLGRKKEAAILYEKMIKIYPDDPKIYNNLGNIYADLGKKEEAIALYKKAIEINPSYATAHFNLSITYYNEKQYNLAIKHCDLAIKLGYKVLSKFLKLLKPHRK